MEALALAGTPRTETRTPNKLARREGYWTEVDDRAQRSEAHAEPLEPRRPFGQPDDAHQGDSNATEAPKQVYSHGRQISQGHKGRALRNCVEEQAEDRKATPCLP